MQPAEQWQGPAGLLISRSRGRAVEILTLVMLLAASTQALPAAVPSRSVSASADDACTCPDPNDPDTPPGVAWQGAAPAPDLPRIAHLLAPVLWFSSDEPLIVLRNGAPVPHAHPADRPAASAVVYYEAADIVLRGRGRVFDPVEADPQFFDKVGRFRLKYFFYYDEDVGLRSHPHDLEVVVLLVHLERTREGCVRLRVERVEGLAHGLDWYTNVHRVERDTVFPITVLVEEGKHASVPDRNGDGVYTPGYDVNARINDAWGLRDVLGSSVLLGARYDSSMSKPRVEAYRLLPPTDVSSCGRPRAARSTGDPGLGRYELRAASDVPAGPPPGIDSGRLYAMMRYHRFGPDWPPEQHASELTRSLTDPENAFRWVSAVNLRLDGQQGGASVQGPGIDLREVWAVPRVIFSDGWSVEALITPSASRWFDWYVAGGYERGIIRRSTVVGGELQAVNGFASEAGLKFRLTVSGRARWAALGYRFAGVRLGVRSSGFSRIQHPRFIVELGAGAF